MANADGSILLVLNGETYNFQELRRKLVARGRALRSNSDSEAIIHAYLFASELKTIEAYPHFPNAWRMIFTSIFSIRLYTLSEFDLSKCFKLPPAHCMVVDTEPLDCSIEPYWQGIETVLSERAPAEDLEAGISRVQPFQSVGHVDVWVWIGRSIGIRPSSLNLYRGCLSLDCQLKREIWC
jgi:asparagine synthetase B (glutamine-hydrolysing)